jgi:hypothetical protein
MKVEIFKNRFLPAGASCKKSGRIFKDLISG